jgi:hypothetical protein
MFLLIIIDEDFGSEGTSKMLLFVETSHAPLFAEYIIIGTIVIDKV